jgi:tetratricopeptide (TPR) repeat protein
MASVISEQETADAERVETAIEALANGNLDQAERLLLAVIANTPTTYATSIEQSDSVTMKFWDNQSFIHYVLWQQEHGASLKNIQCVANAYPRAYYYLGFLGVKRKQYQRALEYLEAGQQLEPLNPRFALEKAQALIHLKRFDEAAAQYDQCAQLSPWVSNHELAVSLRGRGFLLIELGGLDDAERAFADSLKIEPGNGVALNELAYIAQLRRGGHIASYESVATSDADYSSCTLCGNSFDEGVLLNIDNMPVPICKRCEGKLTKKWWQFWK